MQALSTENPPGEERSAEDSLNVPSGEREEHDARNAPQSGDQDASTGRESEPSAGADDIIAPEVSEAEPELGTAGLMDAVLGMKREREPLRIKEVDTEALTVEE